MSVQRYRLDDLGWHAFESLCQSVLIARFAVGIQAWGGSGDWGRDAFYAGILPIPDPSHTSARHFVFQAKFVENANAAGANPGPALIKAVNAELKRIVTADRETPECFVLMTNVSLTASLRTSVETLLQAGLPNAEIVTWGSGELSALLDERRELRIAFPQLLSSRDFQALLAEVINKGAHERSEAMVARAMEEAATFVKTAAYCETINVLGEHGMAVLSGPPEMGKTTIAYSIAFSCAIEGWEYFAIRSAEEFLALHRPGMRQIFVADDAFGTTEYRPAMADEWAASLESVLRKVDRDHWVIWTTRTGPLNMALQSMHLQGNAEAFPDPGSVLVKASDLNQREKALMLYAHAKAATLSEAQRTIVRLQATSIVKHPHLTPKRIRRFVRETLPEIATGTSDVSGAIAHELRTPTDSMRKSFNALSEDHKLYLISALDGPDASLAFARHSPGSSVSLEDVEAKLHEHFVVRPDTARWPGTRNTRGVSWAHPSWRDLVIEFVAESPERRSAFLGRCGADGLTLALSSGGGAKGELRLPFLRTANDWLVLEERLPHLVRDCEAGGGSSELLALAKNVTADSFSTDNEEKERLTKWARIVLEGAREVWNGRQSGVPLWPLKVFYELSERAVPIVSGPDLRATWEQLVTEALEEAQQLDWHTTFSSIRLLAEGCELISRNEPRFLRQVGFPNSVAHIFEQVLEECESYVDADFGLIYREDYESEIEQLESIVELSSLIGRTCPSLLARAESLADDAANIRLRYEERLERGVSTRPDHRQDGRPAAPSTIEDHIDVVKLFSDL